MKTRGMLWTGLVLAGLVGLTIWAFRPQRVSVETAEVVRGRFEQTIDEDGRTRVRDRYVVSAPLTGQVARIGLRAGDRVTEGMLLANLWPSAPPLLDQRTVRELEERVGATQAAAARAVAMVERARVAREQAQADLARTVKLAEAGFVSAAVREQAELTARLRDRELDAARSEQRAAEHEVAQARAALLRVRADGGGAKRAGAPFEVRAPIMGRVLRVIQESEAAVSIGAPLLEIADLGNLEIVVDVLSTEAVGIPAGATVHIDAGVATPKLEGRVRLIEPAAFTKISALGVEEQRVNVLIDLLSSRPLWEALGDGFRVDVRIVVHREDDAVKVPAGALFRDGAAFAVFVVEGGVARKRAVEVPRRNDREALVARGLEPGMRVILFPGDTVRDGVPVRPRQ